MNKHNAFYRLNPYGDATIHDIDTGDVLTQLDADVYPVGSDESARIEHTGGIILTVGDAELIGIMAEKFNDRSSSHELRKVESSMNKTNQGPLDDDRVTRLIKFLTSQVVQEKTWRLEDLESIGGCEMMEAIDTTKFSLYEKTCEILGIEKDQKIYDSFFT